MLKNQPKELKNFLDPLGEALAIKSPEESSRLQWGTLVKPLLDLHLESKVTVAPLFKQPVKEWAQAISQISHGSNLYDVFHGTVVETMHTELYTHHREKVEEMRKHIEVLR
jgi:hypothetical protein